MAAAAGEIHRSGRRGRSRPTGQWRCVARASEKCESRSNLFGMQSRSGSPSAPPLRSSRSKRSRSWPNCTVNGCVQIVACLQRDLLVLHEHRRRLHIAVRPHLLYLQGYHASRPWLIVRHTPPQKTPPGPLERDCGRCPAREEEGPEGPGCAASIHDLSLSTFVCHSTRIAWRHSSSVTRMWRVPRPALTRASYNPAAFASQVLASPPRRYR
jgi:hypothetical protein